MPKSNFHFYKWQKRQFTPQDYKFEKWHFSYNICKQTNRSAVISIYCTYETKITIVITGIFTYVRICYIYIVLTFPPSSFISPFAIGLYHFRGMVQESWFP
jgi:hypothetical protein